MIRLASEHDRGDSIQRLLDNDDAFYESRKSRETESVLPTPVASDRG